MILALDIGRFLGWAAGNPGAPKPASGMITLPSFGKIVDNGGVDYARFCIAFDEAVADLITLHSPSTIYIEAPFRLRDQTYGSAVVWMAIEAEKIAHLRDCGAVNVNVASVRGTVLTGINAELKPDDRVNLFCVMQGWAPGSTHQADALALWAFASRAEAKRARTRAA